MSAGGEHSSHPSDLAKIIAKRIRELRGKRGWEQVDLEAQLDGAVSRSAISHFETARSQPSLDTLRRLAAAFGVNPAALLLDPGAEFRDRVAMAVLGCDDAKLLEHVGKLLDVE
jgi:transcriptional regulator with XRE-family HTH domain